MVDVYLTCSGTYFMHVQGDITDSSEIGFKDVSPLIRFIPGNRMNPNLIKTTGFSIKNVTTFYVI